MVSANKPAAAPVAASVPASVDTGSAAQSPAQSAASSATPIDVTPEEVVAFWKQAGPQRWFTKDDAFDAEFRETFARHHWLAAARKLDDWVTQPAGALALMVLLDQYPRNAFRGTAHMFATDPLARLYARKIVDAGLDRQIDEALRTFCYLPFEHSEDAADQQQSLALYARLDAEAFKWAKVHADIIERFGRFPHRNHVLGRSTTAKEQAFLDDGGFAG